MQTQPQREGGTAISLRSYWRLVRTNTNFRRLWMAQIVSEIGDWFYSIAIYDLLLQMTGRASSVALALVLQVLPQTLVGPIAGVVNDRIRRKQVMIFADLARTVIVFSMLLTRSRSMLWLVYPLLFMESVMWAFFEPARTAAIPNVASDEDLILANTLSSATWSFNLLIGAALGGFALALLGSSALFVLNSLSFLVSALLISSMHFNEPHAHPSARLRLRDLFDYSAIGDGIRYVRRDRRLLATLFVKTGLATMGVSWVLFTVMGERVFPLCWHGLEPQRSAVLGMSMLLGARGIGAVVGPLVSARWAGQDQNRLRIGILLGFLALALGYGALGGAGSLVVACLWVILAHCGGSTVWVFSTTLLQLNTDDKFRGRVFSAELGLSMVTLAVGSYLTGLFLDHGVTPRTVATATGLIMLIPAGLWALVTRISKPAPVAISADAAD